MTRTSTEKPLNKPLTPMSKEVSSFNGEKIEIDSRNMKGTNGKASSLFNALKS